MFVFFFQVTYLSFVGGSKVPIIIRRILEKLFTNKLALLYNWTGKNDKLPLKKSIAPSDSCFVTFSGDVVVVKSIESYNDSYKLKCKYMFFK